MIQASFFPRVLGGLLAAHLIIRDTSQPFGDMLPKDYNDELLLMAHDLANRLLSAFDNTSLGIPYPRVSMRTFLANTEYRSSTCASNQTNDIISYLILILGK